MAIHEGLLQRRLELYLNGAWVDFSDRLLTQALSPNPGRTSGGNTVSPSTISFSLDNPLGDVTPYNAESGYFPHVDVGMLVRWSVFWDGVWYVRGVFEATSVDPHWPYGDLSDGTTTGQPGESYVAISAADILQRLSDNQQPLRSPLYRTITATAAVAPHALWMLEDGARVLSFAAETTGTQAANDALYVGSTDLVVPAGCTSIPGSGPCAQLPAGALINFTPTAYASTGVWAVQVAVHLDDVNSQLAVVIRDTVAATSLTTFVYATTPLFRCTGVTIGTGSTIFTADDTIGTSEVVGLPMSLIIGGSTAAGGTIVARLLDGYGNTIASTSSTGTGITMIPRTVSTQCVPFGGNGSVGVGATVVYNDPSFDITADGTSAARAAGAWIGETSGRRIERLAVEEGIAFTSTGDLDDTMPMGAQPIDTLIAAFRDSESADLGIFHAQRDVNGVHYRTRTDLYNQVPALIIDAAQSELANPFRPTATTKHIFNDVTVDRPGGSSARVIDQDSIDKVGARPRGFSANTETDDQAIQVAGWLLNLGTPDGMHYPSVSSELTIATQLIEDWLALQLGDRIQVVNLPPQHPSDTVDLLADGFTEPHSPSRWTPQINCSPASLWDVAELDDDDLGKLDTAGCVMQAGATSGATSFTVATTVLPRWTTDAGEMPIPILVSGQVNSVTAISNVSPSFVAVGAVAHGNNASVTPTMPAGVQAGDLLLVWAAVRNSGTGVVNTPSGYTQLLQSGNVALLGKVHTGTETAPQITFTGGVANADTSAQMAAFRGVGITVYASTAQLNGSAQDIAYPLLDVTRDNCVVLYLGWKADDWTSVAAIAGATEIGEPDTTTGDDQGIAWDYVIQTTAARIAAGSFVVTGGASAISRGAVIALATDVQTMTVTRGTNGVTKAIPIGSQVNVYRPARLAL